MARWGVALQRGIGKIFKSRDREATKTKLREFSAKAGRQRCSQDATALTSLSPGAIVSIPLTANVVL